MKALPTILFLAILAAGLPAQPRPDASVATAVPETKVAAADPHLDLSGYLAERAAALAIRSRNLDPFGRTKDPSRTPPPPEIDPAAPPVEIVKEPQVDPKAAFEEAVAGLKVVLIGDGEFTLEGGRSLRKGQYFMLSSPQMRFRVQVMAAKAGVVLLQETAQGNRAEISVNLMPTGMSRGGSALMPGQIDNSSELPEIESSNVTQPSTTGAP